MEFFLDVVQDNSPVDVVLVVVGVHVAVVLEEDRLDETESYAHSQEEEVVARQRLELDPPQPLLLLWEDLELRVRISGRERRVPRL